MAFVDVPADPYVQKTFCKLTKVGDKLTGIYVSKAPGNFEGSMDYIFQDSAGVNQCISAKGALRKQLEKAEAAGFEPGHVAAILLLEKKDIGKQNPMAVYKLGVDKDKKRALKVPKPAPPPEDDFLDSPIP